VTLALGLLGLCVFAASAAGGPGRPYAELTVHQFPADADHTVDAILRATIATRSAAAARLVFYVPAGWAVDTSANIGAHRGLVDLAVLDDASPGSEAFLDASLAVADPALGTDAIAQACAPGPHAAVWTGALKVAGRPLSLRFYVDPTTAADGALGAYKVTTCLPSPYLPPEQGGAPAGMQVVEISVLTSFTSAPAGTYTWRVLVTPFVYGEAAADDESTFEARTRMLYPYVVTLRAAYQARTDTIVASGRVLALGKPRAGVKVVIFAERMGGPRDALTFGEVGKTVSRADGTFAVREPRKRILAPGDGGTLEINALVDDLHGSCAPPSAAPAGCVSDTLSEPTTPFPGVRLAIPVARKSR
jgi:hypothetical protein